MEEKKKNGNIIIIVLLVIVILGLGGYIVYDKVLNKEEKNIVVDKKDKAEVKEEKVESLDIYDDLVRGLVGKITRAMGVCSDFREVYLKDSVFTANDFSNEKAYLLACGSMFEEIRGDVNTGSGYKDFSAERLDKAIKAIFGNDYKFEHKSYESFPAWKYDVNSKTYKAQEATAGGCTSGPYSNIIKNSKALKIGDRIEIYQRVIFVNTSNGKGYSDSKKTKEITNLDRYGEFDAISEENDENISKGTLYKLTFKEEDGEYVFVSSEPVNQ